MNHKLIAAALLVLPLLAQAQTPPPAPAPAAKPVAPGPSTAATAPAAEPSVTAAARVALVTGSVTVTSPAGVKSLTANDPVFEGQTINVGPNSYANLKFADGGRVLLRPNTEFAVESYRYSGPAPEAAAKAATGTAPGVTSATVSGNAFFRLVRGGFRAVSGFLGKGEQQQYKVTTPAATIGIRGTDYEVQTCSDDCPSQAQAAAGGTEVAATTLAGIEVAQAGGGGGSSGGGIIVATNEGSVVLRTSRGEFTVDAGQVALALANGETFKLPAVPDALLLNTTPAPEDCQ
jgi:hypothetical protein